MKATPGTPTKAGYPATDRTSGTKGTSAAAGVLATHSLAGQQATAMMKATTATPRAAEMSETETNQNSKKYKENSKITFFCPIGFS